MSKPRVQEESYAMGSARGRITRFPASSGGFYLDGDVVTFFGIVSVYSQADGHAHSRYDFAWRGRHYIITEHVERTELGLAIQAAKIAKRIAGRYA